MTNPTADQLAEIEYISGLTANGTVSGHSFDSWNGNSSQPGYTSFSEEAKWGASVAGTGANLTVTFDSASNWSATEKQAFLSAMHLWSDVANIQFTPTTSSSANLVISRASDGTAEESTDRYYPGTENSGQTGTLLKTSVDIDTSVRGFGPIGGSLSAYSGYPWMTIEHELGHAIGLGHAGPYNDTGSNGAVDDTASLGPYDNRDWSIMSYHDQNNSAAYPIAPMILDITAVQRIYGLPNDSPLSGGGQVFGFHSNIAGDTAGFFDFSVDTQPMLAIWDGGAHNTLDLSGFSQASSVSLVDGSLNSVGGLSNNLGIAFGTRIETVIGGSGNDTLSGNTLDDVIMGGSGADRLTGGSGNDHIYGNMASTVQGSADGGDNISTGGGNDYVNGNAGDDIIRADSGDSRLFGGQGNDSIVAGSGSNHINGNSGNDTITAGSGNDVIFGGQGDDHIQLGSGNTVVSGDLGNDHIVFGTGYVLATGGSGNDIFNLAGAAIDRGGALAGYVDEITDFQIGSDRIYSPWSDETVLHAPGDAVYSSLQDARSEAQTLLGAGSGSHELAAMQVGSDTYLFWDGNFYGGSIDHGVKLDNVSSASFGGGSLATGYDAMN